MLIGILGRSCGGWGLAFVAERERDRARGGSADAGA